MHCRLRDSDLSLQITDIELLEAARKKKSKGPAAEIERDYNPVRLTNQQISFLRHFC